MGKTKKFRSIKRKKRRYCGNQHQSSQSVSTPNVSQIDASLSETLSTSISHTKLASNPILNSPSTATTSSQTSSISGYRFVDMGILADIFSELLCPEWSSTNLELSEVYSHKKGAAPALKLICNHCDYCM